MTTLHDPASCRICASVIRWVEEAKLRKSRRIRLSTEGIAARQEDPPPVGRSVSVPSVDGAEALSGRSGIRPQ